MRITGAVVLALSLGTAALVASPASHAKGKAKAKSKTGGGTGDEAHAPTATASEVDKLKAVHLGDPKAGTFKWGMKPEEVVAEVRVSIEGKYQPRIQQATQDPGKQQRLRDEMTREINAVKKSYTKFEGQKSGWDVSIVGPEFQQGTSEAVLVTKEDQWTRYFFFFEDGLAVWGGLDRVDVERSRRPLRFEQRDRDSRLHDPGQQPEHRHQHL